MIIALLLSTLFFPRTVEASVTITEVAWMGSEDDANAEWIELYNDGDTQDLSGWTLVATDGAPSISLSGVMGAHSHALLERTDDECVPSVTAFLIYTGALGNTGEVLELRDASGTRVDVVDGIPDWNIGGNNETKETLQRSGSEWITAPRTPEGVVSVSSGSGDTAESTSTNKSSSGGNVLKAVAGAHSERTHLKPALTLELEDGVTVYEGVPHVYTVRTFKENGEEIVVSDIEWNFGDGTIRTGREVEHTYAYTGTYIISVTGRRGGFLKEILDTDSSTVTVVEPILRIVEVTEEYVEIENTGDTVLDISGFVLLAGEKHYTFPRGTLLPQKKSVRFLRKALTLPQGEVRLYHPKGVLMPSKEERSLPKSEQVYVQPSVLSAATTRESESEFEKPSIESAPQSDSVVQEVSEQDVRENTVPQKEENSTLLWWILGLVSAIMTTIVGVFVVREERREVIEGYLVEELE